MGIYFDGRDVIPEDGGEAWEWECDHCWERFDLDHYNDIRNHIWEHEAKGEA